MLQKEIISELVANVVEIQIWAETLRNIDESKLKKRPSDSGWSALECIDHLNRYNEFYIPTFWKGREKARKKTTEKYKAGWLGNKMANDMLPINGKLRSTMKTFKSKNPTLNGFNPNALEIFIENQRTLLQILDRATSIDIESVSVPTTISFLRLKLGDALRFVINHQIRHVVQVKRALLNA